MPKHEHHHKHRSKSKKDPNKLFQPAPVINTVSPAAPVCNQNVTVNVEVEQPGDDCLTSCFAGLAKCFGKAGGA